MLARRPSPSPREATVACEWSLPAWWPLCPCVHIPLDPDWAASPRGITVREQAGRCMATWLGPHCRGEQVVILSKQGVYSGVRQVSLGQPMHTHVASPWPPSSRVPPPSPWQHAHCRSETQVKGLPWGHSRGSKQKCWCHACRAAGRVDRRLEPSVSGELRSPGMFFWHYRTKSWLSGDGRPQSGRGGGLALPLGKPGGLKGLSRSWPPRLLTHQRHADLRALS